MGGQEKADCEVIKSFVDWHLHKRSAKIRDACFRQPHFHVGSSTTHPIINTTDEGS